VLGARPLRRTIQREIEDQPSEKILFGEVEAGQIVVVDVEGVDPDAPKGSRVADDKARFTFRGEPKRLTGPGRPAGPAGVNALPEGPGPGPMGAENLSRGAQRPSFLAILLDLGVLVVQMHGRAGPVGHHPGAERARGGPSPAMLHPAADDPDLVGRRRRGCPG
jgi:hypothetical protein